MNKFSGKKFYFLGAFSFFSEEQRDTALKLHNAVVVDELDDSVDFIVEGSHEGDLKVSESQTVFDQMQFCKDVIFTSNASEDDEGDQNDVEDQDEISTWVDITQLVKSIKKIKEDTIYTCLFVQPKEADQTPIIRCLFSYLRTGEQVIFACRGLTGFSDDIPHTQFGLIDISSDVIAAAFESFNDLSITDELSVAMADHVSGDGFFESREPDDELKISKNSKIALKRLDTFQLDWFFVDDSDEGYYRLDETLYNTHKKNLDAEDCWVQKGFKFDVYAAAESVLTTGKGWVF